MPSRFRQFPWIQHFNSPPQFQFRHLSYSHHHQPATFHSSDHAVELYFINAASLTCISTSHLLLLNCDQYERHRQSHRQRLEDVELHQPCNTFWGYRRHRRRTGERWSSMFALSCTVWKVSTASAEREEGMTHEQSHELIQGRLQGQWG